MARVIIISGRNKTSRLNQKVKQLEKQGKKVFSSDENMFYRKTTSAAFRKRIHKTHDVIVNVNSSDGIYDNSIGDISKSESKVKLTIVK